MSVTESDLRANYESLDTEQLLELRGSETLTEVAQHVLEQILNERDVPLEQRDQVAATVRSRIEKEEETDRSLASLGQRLAAQILDFLAALIPVVISIPLRKGGLEAADTVGVLAFFAYLLLADGLPNGQSIGKRIVGTAVIGKDTRKPCTYFQSFVRNFLLLFLGIIDWLYIFGRMRQRLGDIAARTIVVKFRRPEAQPGVPVDGPCSAGSARR